MRRLRTFWKARALGDLTNTQAASAWGRVTYGLGSSMSASPLGPEGRCVGGRRVRRTRRQLAPGRAGSTRAALGPAQMRGRGQGKGAGPGSADWPWRRGCRLGCYGHLLGRGPRCGRLLGRTGRLPDRWGRLCGRAGGLACWRPGDGRLRARAGARGPRVRCAGDGRPHEAMRRSGATGLAVLVRVVHDRNHQQHGNYRTQEDQDRHRGVVLGQTDGRHSNDRPFETMRMGWAGRRSTPARQARQYGPWPGGQLAAQLTRRRDSCVRPLKGRRACGPGRGTGPGGAGHVRWRCGPAAERNRVQRDGCTCGCVLVSRPLGSWTEAPDLPPAVGRPGAGSSGRARG